MGVGINFILCFFVLVYLWNKGKFKSWLLVFWIIFVVLVRFWGICSCKLLLMICYFEYICFVVYFWFLWYVDFCVVFFIDNGLDIEIGLKIVFLDVVYDFNKID